MKEPLDRFVICKKCGHGARLYRNPRGGCIKSCKDAPAVPLNSAHPSPEFLWWVSVVCKKQRCNNFNKPVFLSEHDFESLSPPCCPKCKHKMTPYRDDGEKGNYRYKCKNCQEDILLADLLPNLAD